LDSPLVWVLVVVGVVVMLSLNEELSKVALVLEWVLDEIMFVVPLVIQDVP